MKKGTHPSYPHWSMANFTNIITNKWTVLKLLQHFDTYSFNALIN
ncbi:hypothetical protein [uncultured Gammaproteobacteria bacterium]|nr:hypothetical protein [uncultured Gammaproteobacteria bacterium]